MGPKASASSQHKQHGGNAAFEGDEVQHRAWARREKSRLKTQERRQRDKALRDAGDANAIARYEQQKAVAREYQRAKRRKSTQNAQPLDQKEPATAPQTFEDDPMSGIEDDGRPLHFQLSYSY